MSFSSSLMTSMGISLGGLELATDYLFANSDLYEPELTEVKTVISKKPQNLIVRKVKPVKPKITRDSIINKFNIVQDKPTLIIDTVIDSINTVNNDDDFDFSFESFDEKPIDIIEDIESPELLEASLLMQRLNSIENEDDYNSEIDDELDIEDDELDIEDDNDDFDIEGTDDIDIEDNDDLDIEDIDNIELDDEDDFDIDSLDIDDDNCDDDKSNISTNKSNLSNNLSTQESDEDDFEFEDDIDLDDDDNIEIENESIDDEIDMLDCDDLDIEDDVNDIKVNQPEIKENTVSSISENNKNVELEQLRNEIASLNKEIQKITSNNALKDASKLNENVIKNNKVDNIDSLLSDNKPKQNISSATRYDEMTSEQLYKYVRQFMIKLGVDRKPIEISVLTKEFGERNIKMLIQKSYLIKIGKGVTTGR